MARPLQTMFRGIVCARARALVGPALRVCAPQIRAYANIPTAALAQSFQPEISSLEGHGALLNQTTPSDLLQLVDVVPMIRLYSDLAEKGLGDMVVRTTCRALNRTAKDATYALRTLPQTSRVDAQFTLFRRLKQHCDVVAASFVDAKVAIDRASVGTLLSTYEIVDPAAGVTFYRAIGEAAGSAIPCMVKSGVSLDEIKAAYNVETRREPLSGKGRAAANMAWAYLRHASSPGAVEEATKLKKILVENRDRLPASVYDFVVDAFVGDAPADVALAAFLEHEDRIPHHAAMARLLERNWQAHHDVEAQVKLFSAYLARLQHAPVSEMSFKIVTIQAIRNIFEGSASPAISLPFLERVYAAYDACVSSHSLFLNVTLSEVQRRQWPSSTELRELVLAVLRLYGEDEASPVSFRVRLNALEGLGNVGRAVETLWSYRTAEQMPPLSKLDWLSLVRATSGGQYFAEQWLHAGAPFDRDVRRFCASRGYHL